MTLGIAAIVASLALTAVAFAIPQQALAGGNQHNHNNNNNIKVDQQTSQANFCTNESLCNNEADNTFGPQPVE